jgi:pimeloyl-ACP methyl ester carboxylesterase
MPIRLLTTLIFLGVVLLLLLVGPFLTPIPELDTVAAEQLASEQSQFIDLDGYRIHYIKRGQGTPSYVLLHGFMGNTFSWRHVIDALASGRASLAADASAINVTDTPNTPNGADASSDPSSESSTSSSESADEPPIVSAIDASATVLAYDRLGFGLSGRPLREDWQGGDNPYSFVQQQQQVLELLDRLSLEDVILVAHDTGAALALALVQNYPERFRGVVFVAPVPEVTSNLRGLWRLLYRTPQVDRLGPLFMRQLAGEPGQQMLRSSLADPENIDLETIEGYRRNVRVDNWDDALWELSRASLSTLSPIPAPLSVPALVINSDNNQLVAIERSRELASQLEADMVTLEGCAHLLQESCPVALSESILQWAQ